jgi:hypothetical protein
MRSYIGIDNGTTGSIGVITDDYYHFYQTPVKKEQDYTKKKKLINRIDVVELKQILFGLTPAFALIERPFINPKMWNSSLSAIRAYEATISFLEANEIGYLPIDSKEWQRELLPQGVKGSAELKKASRDIGIRMFPRHKDLIEKQGDADGMLIAEYARRKY